MASPQPFEWDAKKAAANAKKHGVAFAEAQTTFADPHGLDIFDDAHTHGEDRWIRLGLSAKARLITTAYTHRQRSANGFIRIISARRATVSESKAYWDRRI